MKRELLSLQYWNHVKNNKTTNEQISKQHEMQFNQLWLSSSETKYSRLLLSKLQHLVLLRTSFHLLDTSFWCAISQITSQNSLASPFFLPALPSRMMLPLEKNCPDLSLLNKCCFLQWKKHSSGSMQTSGHSSKSEWELYCYFLTTWKVWGPSAILCLSKNLQHRFSIILCQCHCSYEWLVHMSKLECIFFTFLQ